MDIIKFYNILYRDSTHFKETESHTAITVSTWPLHHILHFKGRGRIPRKVRYFWDRQVYCSKCMLLPKKKKNPIRQKKGPEIVQNMSTITSKHAILAFSSKQQLHCSTSCCQLHGKEQAGFLVASPCM